MDATGCPMDEAIADACARGYAEADPSSDLDGVDAAAKLAILCGLAFGLRIDPSDIETRTTARVGAEDFRVARVRGATIRQIARAEFDHAAGSLIAWVSPILVPRDGVLARAEGPDNAAIVMCRNAGAVTLTGRGAGGDASAVAIIGDLMAIARDPAAIVPAPGLVEPKRITGWSDHELAEAV